MSIQILKVPTCRHTLTNGRRCKSPAVTTSAFCYHHQKLRRPRPRTINVPPAPALIRFAPDPLRDHASIRHALNLIIQGLASGELPTGPAGKMLTILNRASIDLSRSAKSIT
jgi:hypothetical protein